MTRTPIRIYSEATSVYLFACMCYSDAEVHTQLSMWLQLHSELTQSAQNESRIYLELCYVVIVALRAWAVFPESFLHHRCHINPIFRLLLCNPKVISRPKKEQENGINVLKNVYDYSLQKNCSHKLSFFNKTWACLWNSFLILMTQYGNQQRRPPHSLIFQKVSLLLLLFFFQFIFIF